MRNGEISKVAVAKERRHGWLETAALDDKPAAEAEATLNSAIVVEPPVVAVAASAEAVLKGEGGRGKGPATRGKGKGGRGGTQPVDLAIKKYDRNEYLQSQQQQRKPRDAQLPQTVMIEQTDVTITVHSQMVLEYCWFSLTMSHLQGDICQGMSTRWRSIAIEYEPEIIRKVIGHQPHLPQYRCEPSDLAL